MATCAGRALLTNDALFDEIVSFSRIFNAGHRHSKPKVPQCALLRYAWMRAWPHGATLAP